MMKFIIVAIVLAAASGSAQRVGDRVRPAGTGGADVTDPSQFDVTSSAALLSGNRRLLEFSRTLQTPDPDSGTAGSDVVIGSNNAKSLLGGYCPLNNAGPWTNTMANYNETLYESFGDFVHDSYLCNTAGNGEGKVVTTADSVGKVYGGAAQDFGTGRANWETYGWSLFKLAARPGDAAPEETPSTDVKIQGVSLHLIGNVGSGHQSTRFCRVKRIAVSIWNADQTTGAIGTMNYSKVVNMTSGQDSFQWNSNSSALLYTDITPDPGAYPTLTGGQYYWLRVKFFADYGGDSGSGTGQCFVFWGLSSQVKNDLNLKARWMEARGGALGYSTTCLGAADAGTLGTRPGQFQTFWNCWNNGIGNQLGTAKRRCSTYRNSFVPAILQADCLSSEGARFNDFNYAFSGFNGFATGAGGISGGGGAGK